MTCRIEASACTVLDTTNRYMYKMEKKKDSVRVQAQNEEVYYFTAKI